MSHELQPDEGVVFPDKKEAHVDYERITAHIQEASEIAQNADVGQESATVMVHPDYPTLPIVVSWMTDIHYGNVGTDYARLNRNLQIIEETPNAYVIFGGDIVDNFSPAKHPIAMLGDAITPQMQSQAMMEKIKGLDRKSKVLSIGFGNHETMMAMAGYDYYQTFMGDIQAPIFNRNGVLNLMVESQLYRIGIFHKFWGRSFINISNSGKRAMEYGGIPDVDAILIGDDHQASAEVFSKNGRRRLVVDGGTYKLGDATGKQWGLGHAGEPGYSIFFWPDQKKYEVVHDPETAKQMMDALVFLQGLKAKG